MFVVMFVMNTRTVRMNQIRTLSKARKVFRCYYLSFLLSQHQSCCCSSLESIIIHHSSWSLVVALHWRQVQRSHKVGVISFRYFFGAESMQEK